MIKELLATIGMVFYPYQPHQKMAWLGWIDDKDGNCLGFIHKDGRIVFDW